MEKKYKNFMEKKYKNFMEKKYKNFMEKNILIHVRRLKIKLQKSIFSLVQFKIKYKCTYICTCTCILNLTICSLHKCYTCRK